jgi:hypothetical protein
VLLRPRRPALLVVTALVIAASLLPVAAPEVRAVGSRVLAFADQNSYGQLGDGTTDAHSSPIELSGMSNIVAVSAGVDHSLALRSDGRVLAWGRNQFGQLGDGTETNRRQPNIVPGLTHVVEIRAGEYYSLARRIDGSVWQWGQRGTETPATWLPNLLTPTVVEGVDAEALGHGVGHRVVATTDGVAMAWGYNGHGQLSDGTTVDRWPALPMQLSAGAVQVGGGYGHSVVRLADGTVKTTGMNDHGQLGDGTTTPRLTLAPVPGLTVEEIAVGDMHALGLLADGTVVSWGHGGAGQLGYLTDVVVADRLSPGPVPDLTGVTGIRAGNFSSAAITADGVWTWGWSTGVEGQEIWGTPLLVAGTEGATDAALGGHHGLFLIEGVPLDLPDPVGTTMSVTSDPEPSYVGEPVTFTVTLDPAPDMGTVEMGIDPTGTTQTAPIDPATGTATFTDTFASASASHQRFFRFDGVPGFEASLGSITLAIERRPTTVTLTDPSARTVGRTQGLTLGATVTPSTAGIARAFDVTDPSSPIALGSEVAFDPTDGTATLVIDPLAVGDHELEIRYLGSASHLPSVSAILGVTVVEGPVVGAPIARIVVGTRAGLGTVPVTVSWDPMGVTADRYELEQRIDSGSWSSVSTTLMSTSIPRTLAIAHTYEYRVRAIDTSEHVGPWVTATSFRAVLTENTSGALWYRGTWSSTSRSSAFSGGSARTTTAPDGRVTLTFTGSGVSWLAALGPTRGRVSVYLDGVLIKTQDLRAAANDTRRLVFVKRWATAGRHTITISNQATSGRPRFDLDAFLIWTGP